MKDNNQYFVFTITRLQCHLVPDLNEKGVLYLAQDCGEMGSASPVRVPFQILFDGLNEEDGQIFRILARIDDPFRAFQCNVTE